MPRRHRITLAASAMEDLAAIKQWYAEQLVPEVGQRLLNDIIGHIQGLASFPNRGRVVPEFGMTRLREIIHPPYRVIYRVEPGRVRVVRVWRSERLLQKP